MRKKQNNKNYIKKYIENKPSIKLKKQDSRSKDIVVSNNRIEEEIMKLDDQIMVTFKAQFLIDEEECLCYPQFFLYHGLRYQNWLDNLKGIFEKGKILAGKYIDGYINYSDNCNDGEYVSLARYEYSPEFRQFVGCRVCLIISPFVEAYQTIYLTFDEWLNLKQSNISVKNRYSYMLNEYQVKDWITLDMVRAIGIPYSYLIRENGVEKTEELIQYIIDLMDNYNILLPIVNTDSCNKVLYDKTTDKVKHL